MTHLNQHTILHTTQRVAWAVFLFALPVTSFPFFPPSIGGDALVRPLSLYPLIILLFLAVIPRLLSRPIPKTILPLLPFILVAITSSMVSLMRGIEPALGISVNARVLRGMLTLAIGTAIYLAVALLPETREDLRYSMRWIYAGGGFALLWGSLQAGYIIHYDPRWFEFFRRVQSYISIRPLHNDRVASLTYEPHWFADQILLLILPWALAAILTGHTVFNWRWRRLTVEWLLFIWALLLLPFTFSRAGLFNMVVLTVLSVLVLRPLAKPDQSGSPSPTGRSWRKPGPVVRRIMELLLVTCVVTLPVYLIGTKNLFFARIWEYWKNEDASISGYISHLGFDARLTYSLAALHTYEAYPVLGVGLGNYAFYFEEMLPYRPIAEVPEAIFNITPRMGRERLITAKNFYLRLLSETGILGAMTFLAFIIAIFGCALYLWLYPDEEWKFWGTASLCGLIAFSLSAFTFDSFVIPNMWVVFGMITAAARVLSLSLSNAGESTSATKI